MSQNKLHLISRRGFLKGMAGVTTLATLPFLRSTGAGTEMLAPAFETANLDFIPAMAYTPLEVTTINPDGEVIEDTQPPEEYETAVIRSLLLKKGYDLHASQNYTIGYRYMSAGSTASVNYLSAYSFEGLCKSIDGLQKMTPMAPQQMEKAHRAKFGNELYEALYEAPNTLRKSVSNGYGLEGDKYPRFVMPLSGLTAEQQVAFVSLPGVANLGAGVNARSYSGFAEGMAPSIPNGDPLFKEFSRYSKDSKSS